jgi:hypothetical protein
MEEEHAKESSKDIPMAVFRILFLCDCFNISHSCVTDTKISCKFNFHTDYNHFHAKKFIVFRSQNVKYFVLNIEVKQSSNSPVWPRGFQEV